MNREQLNKLAEKTYESFLLVGRMQLKEQDNEKQFIINLLEKGYTPQQINSIFYVCDIECGKRDYEVILNYIGRRNESIKNRKKL